MNAANSQSFSGSLRKIVPKILKKLYLVNNAMNDLQVAEVMSGLGFSKGLRTLGIMQNIMEAKTFEMATNFVMYQKAFGSVKKFVLKDSLQTKDFHP